MEVYMLRINIHQVILAGLTTLLISANCSAETLRCERTVYNGSNQTWIVEYQTVYGHVEMNGVNCTSGHCVLAPKKSATAKYFYDNGTIHRGPASKGAIQLIDHYNNVRTMNYYSVDVGQANLCPEIMNYSDASGVTLNSPENGAMNLNSDAW